MKDKVDLYHGPIEELQKRTRKKYERVLFDTFFKDPLVLEAQIKDAASFKTKTLEKMADDQLVRQARCKDIDAIADITYHVDNGVFIGYCFAYRIKN